MLYGRAPQPAGPALHPWTAAGLGTALATLLLAAAVAVLGVRHPAPRALRPVISRLRAAHSGHIGDYAAWLAAGVMVLGLLTVLP